MPATKKQWVTPQLIVLGRGAPEENVLLKCKTNPKGYCGTSQTGYAS